MRKRLLIVSIICFGLAFLCTTQMKCQENPFHNPYFVAGLGFNLGASAAYTANFAKYYLTVPEDIDTSIDLKVQRWKFRLSGADTAIHCYKIGMSSIADSAAYAGSQANVVNMAFGGDALGASGAVETVSAITLTGWKPSVTAGQLLAIWVGRDGGNEAAGCTAGAASTVASYSGPLVISYGSTQ